MPVCSPRPAVRTVLLALSFVVGMVAGTGMSGAVAQGDTSGCVLDPLTLPLFDATPAARIAATPVSSTLVIDTSDETIRGAVEDTVDCINTGDPAREYAIFTQRYLAGQFADPSISYQPAFEQQLALGPTDVEQSFDLIGISNVIVLESGFV